MISFEKVQSIIEEQIMMKHADTKDTKEVRQKVVSVDLGLMCVRKPNDNTRFTMVPVWDVYEIWEEASIASDLWADTELTRSMRSTEALSTADTGTDIQKHSRKQKSRKKSGI